MDDEIQPLEQSPEDARWIAEHLEWLRDLNERAMRSIGIPRDVIDRPRRGG